jgi:hypothetical protein
VRNDQTLRDPVRFDPRRPWGGSRGSPCGGCLTHNDCLRRFDHVVWFAQFASPGEPACGTAGIVAGHPFTCELPRGHGGRLHKDTMGTGGAWPGKTGIRA